MSAVKRRVPRRDVLVAFILIALVTGILLSQRAIRERIVLTMMPTAERAYLLGNFHFDALQPDDYDIEHANSLFLRARALDPSFPFVRHQLARIQFLKGNFNGARVLINEEIALSPDGPASPSSYYIRALINGFAGNYDESAADYRRYLEHDPTNWAATNDLAWVLLKDRKYQETIDAIDAIAHLWPENPWLLNSRAIALFELGRYEEAYADASAANEYVARVTEKEWSKAYPGNDPLIANTGLEAFRKAVADNMHRIRLASEESQNNVQ